MNLTLVEIERFPPFLEPWIIYWSREYKMCAHRCACGCGDVIQLPVDEQNYAITSGPKGVSLRPSIGNWGICDAHYYITNGRVEWMPKWSKAQIAISRQAEDSRREVHYARRATPLQRLRLWWSRFRAWLVK